MLETWGPSAAVFGPLVGAGVIAVLPRAREEAAKILAFLFTGIPLAITIGILADFDYSAAGRMQFEVNVSWIPTIGANYHLGLDGSGSTGDTAFS